MLGPLQCEQKSDLTLIADVRADEGRRPARYHLRALTPGQLRTYLLLQPLVLVVVLGVGWGLASIDLALARRSREASTLDRLRRANRNRVLYVLALFAGISLLVGGDLYLISHWTLLLVVPLAIWALYWSLPPSRTLHATATLETKATTHQLWALLTDKTQLPKWCPGYLSSTRDPQDPNLYHVVIETSTGRRLEGWERVQHTVTDREVLTSSSSVSLRSTFEPTTDGTRFRVDVTSQLPYLAMLLGVYWSLRRRHLAAATDRQLVWMRAAASYIENGERDARAPGAGVPVAPQLITPAKGKDDEAFVVVAIASSIAIGVLVGAFVAYVVSAGLQIRVMVGAVAAVTSGLAEAIFWIWYVRRRRSEAAR